MAPFTSVDRFLDRQFLDLYGRTPTSAERSQYKTQLQSGVPPATVFTALWNSAPHSGIMPQVTRLYSAFYVRTNEPVSYKVSEGRNEIVLMLENTQIGKGNNTRALDTSFFDTAVARVDPTVGPDRSVRVSIKLKEQVAVQTRQEGNTISLEFARPGR